METRKDVFLTVLNMESVKATGVKVGDEFYGELGELDLSGYPSNKERIDRIGTVEHPQVAITITAINVKGTLFNNKAVCFLYGDVCPLTPAAAEYLAGGIVNIHCRGRWVVSANEEAVTTELVAMDLCTATPLTDDILSETIGSPASEPQAWASASRHIN